MNSDSNSGSTFQMSIQATVSIEPAHKRQQLAPLNNSQGISPVISGSKANDIGQHKRSMLKKGRVYLQSLGSNHNNNP